MTSAINDAIPVAGNPVDAVEIRNNFVTAKSEISALQSNIALAELLSNKSTSVVSDQSSNTKYPSVKSVYDWVVSTFQTLANKDASGGYAGLTLFKIDFKNAANTFTSFLTNSNTAARTYTFQDKDYTPIGIEDVTTTTEGVLINGATAKTTPVDADMLGLMDSAANNILKKLSWANVKAVLKTYFDTLYLSKAGAWTAYTPTITAGSGTFTTVSAAGRYTQIDKTVHFRLTITITTNGTAAANVTSTLPINAFETGWICAGREHTSTGKMLQGRGSGASSMVIYFYDNTYPGGDGRTLNLSGTYEAA